MKFSKSLLAVSMSAMMLFSAPVANAGILQCQTVEAAVSKTSKDRVGGSFRRRPLTPPDMRFRIRRFS